MNVCVLCWFEGNGLDQMGGLTVDDTTTANFFWLTEFSLKRKGTQKEIEKNLLCTGDL